MPRVPRLSDNRITSDVSPSSRVSMSTQAGVFGGDDSITKAGMQLSDTVMKIAMEEKQKADKAKADSMYNDFSLWRNQFISSAMQKQLDDAFHLTDEFKKEFDKAKETIGSKVSNQEQQLMFDQIADSIYLDTDYKIQNHVAQQRTNYSIKNSESVVGNDIQYAIDNFNDPLIRDEKINKLVDEKDGYVNSFYWLTKDGKKEKRQDILNTVHVGVINQFLESGQLDKAEEYFNSNKDNINKSVFNEADLEGAIDRYNAQSEVSIAQYKHDNQKLFNEQFAEKTIAEQLYELENGKSIGKYNSDWTEARRQEILSAKGIDANDVLEYENDVNMQIANAEVIYDTTEKGKDSDDFLKNSKQFLRNINEIDKYISEGVAQGFLSVANAGKLRKKLYSKERSFALQAIGDKDDGFWGFGYYAKDANSAFKKELPVNLQQKALKEFFDLTDGVELTGKEKKDITQNIIKKHLVENRNNVHDNYDKENENLKTKQTIPSFKNEQEALDYAEKNPNVRAVMINGIEYPINRD